MKKYERSLSFALVGSLLQRGATSVRRQLNVIYFYHEAHEGLEEIAVLISGFQQSKIQCFVNFNAPAHHLVQQITQVSSLHCLHVLHGKKQVINIALYQQP